MENILCFSMGWLEGGGVEDMPYLGHVVGAECCENKVPFFGMLYLRHIAGTGDFPLKPCAGQSGEMKAPD